MSRHCPVDEEYQSEESLGINSFTHISTNKFEEMSTTSYFVEKPVVR
jgi:hypothetical protein